MIDELTQYPEKRWNVPAPEKWRRLCSALSGYAPPKSFCAISKERKWELVSAFQKSIRRGDKSLALHLVSAMDTMPEEYSYFWRRLCVTACEDVGPADDMLALFVVACSTVFFPKKTGEKNYQIICFLTEQMCALPLRSHIYCSCASIGNATVAGDLPELVEQDSCIAAEIIQRRGMLQAANDGLLGWQRKNDWRAEGLLRLVGLRLPLEMSRVIDPVPSHQMLGDLPSYAFDVHTRIGLAVLRRLVQGVDGAEEISRVFWNFPIKSAHKALGEVLFSVEGGRIENELIYEPLSDLEQRVFAHKFGLPFEVWMELRNVLAKALEQGVIDRLRRDVLQETYGPSVQGRLGDW